MRAFAVRFVAGLDSPTVMDRKDAVCAALISLRMEGLEPNDLDNEILDALADGRLSHDEAVLKIKERWRNGSENPKAS